MASWIYDTTRTHAQLGLAATRSRLEGRPKVAHYVNHSLFLLLFATQLLTPAASPEAQIQFACN